MRVAIGLAIMLVALWASTAVTPASAGCTTDTECGCTDDCLD